MRSRLIFAAVSAALYTRRHPGEALARMRLKTARSTRSFRDPGAVQHSEIVKTSYGRCLKKLEAANVTVDKVETYIRIRPATI
jgi:hypothetical protein